MHVDSNIDATTYGNLASGDVFVAIGPDGNRLVGMKVTVKGDPSDQPSHEVLVLEPEALFMFSAQALPGKRTVAKIKEASFLVRSLNKNDASFSIQKTGATEGCAWLINGEFFL